MQPKVCLFHRFDFDKAAHQPPKSDARHILPSVEQEPRSMSSKMRRYRRLELRYVWTVGEEKKKGYRSTSPNVVGDYGSENAVAGQSDGSKVSVSPREKKMASTGSRALGLESDRMNAEDWTAQDHSRLPVRSGGCMYVRMHV